MKIFAPLYLKISKRRFYRPFKPLGIMKKFWHLVSVPENAADFFKAVPFLMGLSRTGNVVLLMSKKLEMIRSIMKTKQFDIIIYEKPPLIFSEDYKRVAVQLDNRHFHFLIELNQPPNISLPYLGHIQKRISFYGKGVFPYYNILVKDGYTSLSEFLNVEPDNGKEMFHFYSRELKAIERKFAKKRPLLFVNEAEPIEWQGSSIVVGKDIMSEDPEVWKVLYITDAYHGRKDAFYEFALIHNKEIVTKQIP